MKKIIATVLGSFVIISSLLGQNYVIKNYSISEGLKGTMVYCFYQDSLGFIWMGTNAGLSRYDGNKFINYNKPEELSKQNIKSINLNINGNLLLLTNNGKVWEFDGLNYRQFSSWLKMPENEKITILNSYKQKLFIGTNIGLFIKEKDGQLKTISKIKGKITSFEIDAHDNLYIINQSDGVFQYVNNSVQFLFPHNDSPHKNILKHNKGDFWSNQSPKGVFQKKAGKWQHIFGSFNKLLKFLILRFCIIHLLLIPLK